MEGDFKPDPKKNLKRGFFNRLFGKPATGYPKDPGCWHFADKKIIIDLSKAPELSNPGGAILLEGHNIPDRVLLIHGDDGKFHAFLNKCKHANRRLDPVPGALTVQCCSINKATYDYNGNVLKGPAKEPIKVYNVESDNGKLIISIS